MTVEDRVPFPNAIEYAFLSSFRAPCKAIPQVCLSQKIFTAFTPASFKALEEAAFKAMRPEGSIAMASPSTLMVLRSNIS